MLLKVMSPAILFSTLIKDDTLGPRAYRFAETLEEAMKEEDGINVLKIEYEIIRRNKRTRYN